MVCRRTFGNTKTYTAACLGKSTVEQFLYEMLGLMKPNQDANEPPGIVSASSDPRGLEVFSEDEAMLIRTKEDIENLTNAVSDLGWSPTNYQVFRAIAKLCDPNHLIGAPTQQQIADLADVNKGTSNHAVDWLERQGIIRVIYGSQHVISGVIGDDRRSLDSKLGSHYAYVINLDHPEIVRAVEIVEASQQ